MLTLLASKSTELKQAHSIINNFAWGGTLATTQNRVQLELVVMPRSKDGLGLNLVVAQAKALCLKLFYGRSSVNDTHPLQLLIWE